MTDAELISWAAWIAFLALSLAGLSYLKRKAEK